MNGFWEWWKSEIVKNWWGTMERGKRAWEKNGRGIGFGNYGYSVEIKKASQRWSNIVKELEKGMGRWKKGVNWWNRENFEGFRREKFEMPAVDFWRPVKRFGPIKNSGGVIGLFIDNDKMGKW